MAWAYQARSRCPIGPVRTKLIYKILSDYVGLPLRLVRYLLGVSLAGPIAAFGWMSVADSDLPPRWLALAVLTALAWVAESFPHRTHPQDIHQRRRHGRLCGHALFLCHCRLQAWLPWRRRSARRYCDDDREGPGNCRGAVQCWPDRALRHRLRNCPIGGQSRRDFVSGNRRY